MLWPQRTGAEKTIHRQTAATRPHAAAAPQVQPHNVIAVESVARLQSRSPRRWTVHWDDRSGLPRVLSGGRTRSYAGTATEAADGFLRDHAGLFALADSQGVNGDRTKTELVRTQALPNATKVTLRQTYKGLPVIGAQIGVVVDAHGRIVHATSAARVLPPIDIRPVLTMQAAITRAAGEFNNTSIRTVRPPRLAVFPSAPPRLAYDIDLAADMGYAEPWRLVVDAKSGAILRRTRLVQELTRAFNPNPVATLNNTLLRDDNDADSAVPPNAYVTVALQDLDPPVGGVYALKGAFAWMKNHEIPTNIPPTSIDGEFPFLRSDDGFEEVMGYYAIDRNQAYIQSLGFVSVNNRPVEVDAHGFFGADNSRYVAAPLGAGYLSFGDGGVDDAEDADIILHEYGHAIQDNSAPGIYFGAADHGYGNETGAMGEGFGDYWAASAGYETSLATGFPAAYVGEWDAKGYAGGPEPFLRRVDSPKVYPADMTGEVHADGEIWSAALWSIFLDAGRSVTDRIVLYSHFLVPTDPDFADGAQALIDADALLFPVDSGDSTTVVGAHYNTICLAMGDRGILTCAAVCACGDHGDPDGNGFIDVLDVAYTIDEVLLGASIPANDPLCPLSRVDYNCDQILDVLDVGYAVDYVLRGGAAPCDPCAR